KGATAASIDEGQVAEAEREALAPFARETGANPFLLHEDLKDKMQTFVGIIRSEEDLKQGLSHLERIGQEVAGVKVDGNRHYNGSFHQAFDMRNMLIVSEAMA